MDKIQWRWKEPLGLRILLEPKGQSRMMDLTWEWGEGPEGIKDKDNCQIATLGV